MAARHRNRLARDLEEALAAQAVLAENHRLALRAVARSPPKHRSRHASPSKQNDGPIPPDSRSRLPAAPALASYRPPHETSKGQLEEQLACTLAEQLACTPEAQRTHSPTASQDTVGRQIDREIAKSIEGMLCTPPGLTESVPGPAPEQEPAVRTEGRVQVGALYPSPAFLTQKRVNMHCELDDPGLGVPFPHRYSRGSSRGFWGRMCSCFAPQQQDMSPARTPAPYPSTDKVSSMLLLHACDLLLRPALSSFFACTSAAPAAHPAAAKRDGALAPEPAGAAAWLAGGHAGSFVASHQHGGRCRCAGRADAPVSCDDA